MPRYLDPAVARANMIAKGLRPLTPWTKSSDEWPSICMTCEKPVTPIYRNVMQPGRGGCDDCARRAAAAKRRVPDDQAVADMRAAGVEPLEPYPGTDAMWRCRCLNALCPGLWMGDPADIRPRRSQAIVSAVSACKYCARVAVRPERAVYEMIKAGVRPLEPFVKAVAPWPCECLRCSADDITPTYANVVLTGQGGCRHCGGRMRVPEEQAISEMLAVGAKPLAPYPGVNERWACRCLAPDCPGPSDRMIFPRLGWVRRGAQACKWCAGVVIDADTARETMINRARLMPLEPYPGVRAPWKCLCLNPACKSIVYPTLGSVNSRGSGCSECAESGFKRDQPALVYLLEHHRLNAAKVGICNLGTGRIEKHEGRGWRRYESLNFDLGRDAEALEQEAIAEWRAQAWKPVRDQGATYDGWTETVALSEETTTASLWAGIVQLHALISQ